MGKVFKVRMLAFMTEKGQPTVYREVDVENFSEEHRTNEILGGVYYWGQNDFQPVKDRCSVSVGDVIEVGDDFYRVDSCGFSKMTPEELADYEATDRLERYFYRPSPVD